MDASWPTLRRWLLATCAALLFTAELSAAQNDSEIDLTPAEPIHTICKREDGREGLCVPFVQCYKNHTLAIGGDIPDYQVRAGGVVGKCPDWMWCCTNDTATPTATPTSTSFDTSGCVRVYREQLPQCPWCVALYRPGGDVLRGQRTASGLYCAGALVGARVVLTSATCVRTAAEEATWVRVPAAADRARRYTVLHKITHENYSTGTHANDFGLLVLNADVQWEDGPDPSNGACIDLQSPLEGACFAAGFNTLEDIVMTAVSVHSGNCRARGRQTHASSEVACGVASDQPCPIVPGAPVVCRTVSDEQGGLVITGVVRQTCIKGSAMLGKIQMHEQWLQTQLQRLGVEPIYYKV